MFSMKHYVVIESMTDVPSLARSAIRQQLAERIGGSVSSIFPEFSASFPMAVESMEKNWPKPKLALKDMGRDWHVVMFLEDPDRTLFFDDPFPMYAHQPYFDLSMVPEDWAGLYQSMSSFTITAEAFYSCIFWRNTLLPRGLGATSYCKEHRLPKTAPKALARRLGIHNLDKLRCWMVTDARDSLWVDEESRSRIVYHVAEDKFDDAAQLPFPTRTVDNYLAHVIAGRSPADFDFRKPG